MVTLFSKPNCQPCRLTKMKLERDKIPFQERDIIEDPSALEEVKNLGYLAAPVVLTGSGDHWSGFRPDRLSELI